jgi:hypothetical protein
MNLVLGFAALRWNGRCLGNHIRPCSGAVSMCVGVRCFGMCGPVNRKKCRWDGGFLVGWPWVLCLFSVSLVTGDGAKINPLWRRPCHGTGLLDSAFWVPALLVTHYITFVLLLTKMRAPA